MRGNDTAGVGCDQLADKTYGAIVFIVAIGATENLIEYNKSFFTGLQLVNDTLQTFQFCIKKRFTVL